MIGGTAPDPASAGCRWLDRGANAPATIVGAWRRREAHNVPLDPWSTLHTDGWSIHRDNECVATRLRMTADVALSARRYRGSMRELVRAIAAEIARGGEHTVELKPPYPVFAMTRLDLERAWEVRRRRSPDDDYLDATRHVVNCWLAGGACVVDVAYLEVSAHGGAMWAAGDCVAVRAPQLRRVALVSAKRYRAGGSPQERHRGRVRDAVDSVLAELGFVVRRIRPIAEPYEEIRPRHLLAGWSQSAPTLDAGPRGSE